MSSSTVTFLFTDVEGSTMLVRQLREQYPAVLAEHRRLLIAASGTRGATVDVLGIGGKNGMTWMTTVLIETLRRLGYRTGCDAWPESRRTSRR